MMTKREATKVGKALVRMLNQRPILSKGWKVVVWENLGWHAKAVSVCGFWKVHPNGDSFTAFLGVHACGGKWAATERTAEAAINAVRARARSERREIEKLLRGTSR